MNKKERKRKLKIYEMLGAKKFQKFVFMVETLKFEILKKVFPNFLEYHDKYCNYKKNKALKRAKTEEERKIVQDNYKIAKMSMRRELNRGMNRNYHIDPHHMTDIYDQLEWNKKVHKVGLIKDAIAIPILAGASIIGFAPAIPLLALEIASAGINFECVNIQNYNLCRLEGLKEKIEKREQRRIQRNIEEYKEGSELIHKCISEKEDLPTYDEIIGSITSIEQLRQIKKRLLEEAKERNRGNENVVGNVINNR